MNTEDDGHKLLKNQRLSDYQYSDELIEDNGHLKEHFDYVTVKNPLYQG